MEHKSKNHEKTEMFDIFFEILNVRKENSVMFGDTLVSDIEFVINNIKLALILSGINSIEILYIKSKNLLS